MNRILVRIQILILLPIIALASACSLMPGNSLEREQTETIRYLKILHTNDEHGWMEPYRNTSGAAGLAFTWRHQEGLEEGAPILVLSGGDMWTGPALSTANQGASMVEVMNAMGYDAAAIGNHDFDFGIENIIERQEQAEFPFLSANIVDQDTGNPPAFANPFEILEVNGIKVGVLGLTTVETPVDTKPSFVEELSFVSYDDALRDYVPLIREQGADLIVVLGHICSNEMQRLSNTAAELKIQVIAGGHCHEEYNELKNDIALFQSTYFLRGFTRTELLVDITQDEVVVIKSEFIPNDGRKGESQIEGIIDDWRTRSDPQLWEPIGYLQNEIGRTSYTMAELILRPWLDAWPTAQVALASPRYLQQDIRAGEVTPATIWGVLSTENVLYEIEITGEQLIQTVKSNRPLVLGLKEAGEFRLDDGTPIDVEGHYRVLVPDTIYAGGNYYQLYKFDPDPLDTGIDWRQPVIEWIRSLGTDRSDPLDNFLKGEH